MVLILGCPHNTSLPDCARVFDLIDFFAGGGGHSGQKYKRSRNGNMCVTTIHFFASKANEKSLALFILH